MKTSDYADSIGYLRVLEKRILTNSGFERIIDAPSGKEACKMLSQNSDYDFSSLEHSEDYEIVLKSELKRIYETLYKLSPSLELIDVLRAKYDYHDIKVTIKAHFLNEDYSDLLINIKEINVEEIKKTIKKKESRELSQHIVLAINEGIKVFETSKDPQTVDIILDKLMFSHMLEICESLDISLVTDYVKTSIDFYNIKALLRIKNMQKGLKFLNDAMVDGGSTDISVFTDFYDKPIETMGGNFYYKYFGKLIKETSESFEKNRNYSKIEKLMDDFLLNMAKSSKYIAFGPEPLFAYIVAKENEIKQVRILITCKFNNISPEILRERLRDNYA